MRFRISPAAIIICTSPVWVAMTVLLSILYGAKEMDAGTIWAELFHFDPENVNHQIVRFSRLTSSRGRKYRIYTGVPLEAPPEAGYPVIYLLDANGTIGTAVERSVCSPAGPMASDRPSSSASATTRMNRSIKPASMTLPGLRM
ncbi:hypothetical protein [Paenibacillus puerhi]|uniref:hypothetical protein n=1 Tax=Paenibacillus puerhi TaxID=2692622 RepID=UPI00135AADE9|nr:hypothetical protein [Paenibacillus puerhi]